MVSRRTRRIAVAVLAVVVVVIAVAISWPNLMRSRVADSQAKQAVHAEIMPYVGDGASGGVVGGVIGGLNAATAPAVRQAKTQENAAPDQMIVRSAVLDLRVRDVSQTVQHIRHVTSSLGGYVEKSSVTDSGNGPIAEMVLRVPQTQLDSALGQFKSTARKVDREETSSQDVTRQYVDSQARMRNLRAEEGQYLAIMRRASTVQDTLDVSEKLSDVRGRIEELQGELNYLSHTVEMSLVTISIRPEMTAVASVFEWHPGLNARAAWRDMVAGLASFADLVIFTIIYIPLILLWAITVLALAFAGWRTFRWVRPRLSGNSAVHD